MKKAYIIPLVILLLFVSVVPSFAVETDPPDYQIPLYNLITSVNSLTVNGGYNSFSRSLGSLTVYGCTFNYSGVRFNSLDNAPSGHTFIIAFDFMKSNNYQLWLSFYSGTYLTSLSQFLTPVDGQYTHFSYTFTVPNDRDLSWCVLQVQGSGLPCDVSVKNVNIFDVTDTGYTVDQLEQYGVFDSTFQGDFAYLPNFFDPVLDTYSHLLDPFVHISENFSTYSVFFTFAGIILSVLILIFVTVFIIKRFTGGYS